jgi:ABC-2 type transport system permease protein
MLENYAQGIVANYLSEINGGNIELISAPFRMYFNEDLKSSSNFVPGSMMLILMLISAMMTSISIVREKELGTMEVLLVSPLRPIQIILGKVVPYFTLSVVNMMVILAIGFFVFDVPIRGSLILLFLVTLLFILLALSLGIMISTIAKTQQTAMVISLMGLMLPTMLLSGFIFPLRNMPAFLQYLSLIMPPRWFLEALRSIMLKGANLTLIWPEVLILLGMLVFFIAVSVKKFKVRIE